MIIRKLYEYRDVERVTRPDGVRHYVCPDSGQHLPSVTTILSATGEKPELIAWRKRVGDAKADQIRDQALALGTLMHTHLENHVLGADRPGGTNLVRKQASRMADQIIQHGLGNVDEIWGSEVALTYPDLFAGTTDLVGVYKGVPAIMDFKTAKKMRTKDKIEDYFLQGAAYSLSHNLLFGTEIDTIVIFMVDRDFHYGEFVVSGAEFQHYTGLWLDRLAAFYNPPGLIAAA